MSFVSYIQKTMDFRFHLFIVISCFPLEQFVVSELIFSRCGVEKPQNCDKDSLNLNWPSTKIRFSLYTRKTQKDPERLHLCRGTLPKKSSFNPKNRLIVIIPGYMSGTCEGELPHLSEIKDELLKNVDVNVILMVTSAEYGNEFLAAMANTEKAANIAVQVLRNIQAKTGIKNENVYLIGHSLGAHVAGLIGQQFKVRRITALDPAGVIYTKDTPVDKRLDPSDADLVDVIHTNGGTGLPYLGAYFAMGDADFYINGGYMQPSCTNSIWNILTNGMSSIPSLCSHIKSAEYYKKSINSTPGDLIAYACSSYKKFTTGDCKGNTASSVPIGYGFENSFTQEQSAKQFPRKYYLDTEN